MAQYYGESNNPGAPPSFWMFSADFLSQSLQNFLVVRLVNRSACRNKLLMYNAAIVRKVTNMLVMFNLTCLAFYRCRDGRLLH
jgi:hypothetical protein